MRPTRVLAMVAALVTLSGCADYHYRKAQGLEWRLYELQQDRELARRGFTPYGRND